MGERNSLKWGVKCTRIKRNGEPCKAWAMRGGTLCEAHGGMAPQIRAKAARRLKAKELNEHTNIKGKTFDKLIRDLEIDAAGRGPTEILLDVVYRAHALVQLFGAVVGQLGLPADAVDRPDSVLYKGGDGKPHVAVVLYQESLTRAGQAAKLALDAGVSEQLVKVEQEKGRLLAQVINAVIADPEVGLSELQQGKARTAAAGHLRLLAGG